jgi:hypothetical protein
MTTQNEFEEALKCAFADAGAQMGSLIRCMVDAQIAAKLQEISALNAILAVGGCTTSTSIEQGDVLPPT